MHATEFLNSAEAPTDARVIALVGEERYLKQKCLRRLTASADADDDDLSLVRINGSHAAWRDVLAELSTLSMFGDRRIVLIEDADTFVSDNRAALERYVDQPARGSVLILDVRSFPGNTRLAKAVTRSQLRIDATELKAADLTEWLRRTAAEEYRKRLDRDAALLIIQLAGSNLGQLDQEIAKLVSLVGEAEAITVDDVTRVVGGWRLETTWAMLDAVRDNRPAFALEALAKLLNAGEAPQKTLGGTVFVFRKYAEATELARTGTPLGEAIRTAGIHPMAAAAAERYLRRLGFARASRILSWLAEADHAMKGGSRVDPQLVLERLFVQLSGAEGTTPVA